MSTTTRMTARVPTTPETHSELKEEKERRDDVDTFDALLQALLAESKGGVRGAETGSDK